MRSTRGTHHGAFTRETVSNRVKEIDRESRSMTESEAEVRPDGGNTLAGLLIVSARCHAVVRFSVRTVERIERGVSLSTTGRSAE